MEEAVKELFSELLEEGQNPRPQRTLLERYHEWVDSCKDVWELMSDIFAAQTLKQVSEEENEKETESVVKMVS